VAPLADFERVVVDDGAGAEALRELDEHKVAYEVATTS
jgi:hypothetical protein